MSLPFEKIKREILIKKESTTNINYGLEPEKRTTKELINSGVVNINKPAGPTSHQISDYVQKILNINKAGHSGSLDPGVTGCLPIALENSTRITHFLLTAGKEYVCLMHIHKQVSQSLIHKTLKKFTGKIIQLPPVRSAVKREEREREIYEIEVLEIKDKDVLFKVSCQAGTYIRKLCHEIGQELKTGAHMSQLIRTKAGPFTDKNMHSLQELKDAYVFYKQGNDILLRKIILPIESALAHLPKILVFDSTIEPLCHGNSLAIPGISKLESNIKENDLVAVFSLKNELVCLGKALLSSEDIMENEKGLALKTEKVFMKPGTYPKMTTKKE